MYRPKNGEPEVQCALKYLKQADELPNQKVHCTFIAGKGGFMDVWHPVVGWWRVHLNWGCTLHIAAISVHSTKLFSKRRRY